MQSKDNNLIMELDSIDIKYKNRLIDFLSTFNRDISYRLAWKSKYNSYIVYDYEPFCSDGFYLQAEVESTDFDLLQFIEYLWKKQYETMQQLESNLQLEEV